MGNQTDLPSHPWLEKLRHFSLQFWYPAGLIILCAGFLYLPSRGSMRSAVDVLFFLPALVLALTHIHWVKRFFIENKLLSAFMACSALSVSWAVWIEDPKEQLGLIVLIVLFLWSFWFYAQTHRALLEKTLLVACITTAFGCAGHMIYYYLVEGFPLTRGLYTSGEMRLLSGNPHYFFPIRATDNTLEASMLAIPQLFVLLGFLVSKHPLMAHRLVRTLTVVAVALLLAYIVVLQRRSGYLATGAMFAVMAFARSERIWKWLLAGGGAILVLILAWNADILLARGLSGRDIIWAQAFQQAMDAPLWGHGVGARNLYIEIVVPRRPPVIYADPHNMHLGVLFYQGIVGLGLWLALWLPTAWKILMGQAGHQRALYLLPLIPAMLTASFIHGEIFYKFYESWFCTWFVLALLLASKKRKEEGTADTA